VPRAEILGALFTELLGSSIYSVELIGELDETDFKVKEKCHYEGMGANTLKRRRT
jgi:hypothetical protein